MYMKKKGELPNATLKKGKSSLALVYATLQESSGFPASPGVGEK